MNNRSISCNTFISSHSFIFLRSSNNDVILSSRKRRTQPPVSASNSRGVSLNSILKGCQKCKGKGSIECPGCKGTGKNKKNGNIFERWKCFDCQGFGLRSCPSCGKGGLTPEQRGER